jgi:acyl-CoA synthetase (AMP-forming)/AMP-acid ligase II/acyl carrier protein
MNASRPMSVAHLLESQASARPSETALAGPGLPALAYGGLWTYVQGAVASLNALGVGAGDRVAILLPNGIASAAAFFAVSAGASAAPLNPAYQAAELEFFLADLEARALLVADGQDSPARDVATALHIPVVELSALVATASTQPIFSDPSHEALVLHTSGTTSRPKLVPLTHANICTSAHNIVATLNLGPQDRCLNVMPLFHIHGLIGALLSSIAAGAGVVCTPGFDTRHFFAWLDEFDPTWYTAVPTIHQAVLAAAPAGTSTVARAALRFLRSSSAALPTRVMAELEALFRAPVIESYGMTEASHQMASNPLPPRARKPGSVGVAAGPEVAIMDERGAVLGAGRQGEIVIRGANVTRGYHHMPSANQQAFTNGWFRTGDQGYLDDDGYLFLTGRLKEIINRGGEKISPREVDDILMEHPAVAQAITFALPHPSLGQDVAAAVVLRPNIEATEVELRRFCARRLAAFKVPNRFAFVDQIPKGPTGKPQRIGLAEKLGLLNEGSQTVKPAAPFVAPSTPLESELAAIWCELLRLDQVGVHDEYSQIGGDSLLAAQLITRIEERLQIDSALLALEESSTIADMARRIQAHIR